MQRVLCYSPYNQWTLHGLWELTILRAVQMRGAEVRLVHCDGLYASCDMHWQATAPRTEGSCGSCQVHVATLSSRLGFPFEWLGRYVLPADLREARRWADALSSACLRGARYGEWSIGEWVVSSVNSDLRDAELDETDEAVVRSFREYLYSGLVACFAVSRLLDDFRPDLLFVLNGRLSSLRVALELARMRGIRVVCHERGARTRSLFLFENAGCHDIECTDRMWRDWGGIPLADPELRAADELLRARAEGRDTSWHAFNSARPALDETRARLSLGAGRPVWAIFTTSSDETVSSKGWESALGRQVDWMERTVAWAARHPEIDFVLRAHPNIGGPRATGVNRRQIEELRSLRSRAPLNMRVVMPEEELSSYALMDLACVGLVFQSTVGWEMASRGKTVVMAAGSRCSGLPFVHTVGTVSSYEPLLDSLASTPASHFDPEVRRLAYRFVYGFYFRFDIPFPLVDMPDPHSGRLAYSSLDELERGRCPSLDRICRILLEGESVCPPPTARELARTEDDEIAFFGLAPVTAPRSKRLVEPFRMPLGI